MTVKGVLGNNFCKKYTTPHGKNIGEENIINIIERSYLTDLTTGELL